MSQLEFVDAPALKRRIGTLLTQEAQGALVFDADGTLWAHDVGCVVFEAAIARSALKPEARAPLAVEAAAVGLLLDEADDANDIARKLDRAHLQGRYPLKRAAEMQVWAYAGFTEVELRELCRDALHGRGHLSFVHAEVVHLANWARSSGAGVFIVSASPRIVVEEAARELGFEAEHIAAGDPIWHDDLVGGALGAPLPYGPEKAIAGRRLVSDTPWLATFGDSGFDLEMMAEAQLAVGVGDKPELLEGLRRHRQAVRLRLDGVPRR